MNETPPVNLETGMLVVTSDGDELGRIKELDGTCFKVDAPAAIDYWIGGQAVDSTEFGVARLSLPKDSFNRRKELDVAHNGMHQH